jgi:ubiquinone/menaquinone biosynthesis methyltransferase
MVLANVGVYNIQFSAQLVDTAAGDSTIHIWLKKNGQNVPNSAGRIFLKANPKKIIGVDISEGMLKFGREKIEKLELSNLISLQYGDAEHLDFNDNYFDIITVSFGVRNFENLQKGMTEMGRVLKKGGCLVVLELSKPTNTIFGALYWFYFKYIWYM